MDLGNGFHNIEELFTKRISKTYPKMILKKTKSIDQQMDIQSESELE